ncbi:DUF429 domain-containing protein [Proteinivorax tanatarense]|uniref:DUF429 domain-containing protein n=1 Tax=Proteinivorax tanatarense TaxID=1260629 RepID=A0AAU7VM66_9FIRM
MKIIGIDCATKSQKTGLALGHYENGTLTLKDATLGFTKTPIAQTIYKWINPDDKVLLAVDAPLGWPQNLGSTLTEHIAGEPLESDSNNLFRRETDKFIKRNVNKQPLDVGADRIARTAHSALAIMMS